MAATCAAQVINPSTYSYVAAHAARFDLVFSHDRRLQARDTRALARPPYPAAGRATRALRHAARRPGA